ncbi:MAG: NAD(P)H-dependent glycerol-3-phosphate dehydrogenase [Oscillospiraceae bacterium]
MKVSVIGCGRWGSFIAWYLASTGHDVTLYGRAESKHMQAFIQTRQNSMLTLPDTVHLTTNFEEALQNNVVLISVPSQSLRALLQQAAPFCTDGRLFVLCMKGIEIGTGLRLSQVVQQTLPASCRAAVWLGPGHVQEFVRAVPNCMVIDAQNPNDKEMLVQEFSSDLIRFYYGEDLIGNEIGAAAKNVIGIAAGMLDGFALTSLKGALMSRGTREVARLIAAAGGKELSAYGLCHLGDYEATLFSQHSHNRRFGESFVKGEDYSELAEGYYTVKALLQLAAPLGVDMPICNALNKILYEKEDPKKALGALFARSLKPEFGNTL